MIKNIVVQVGARTAAGKNAARRLRRDGAVPGIVYGLNRPPFPVAVNPKTLEEILRQETGRNTIFSLALADQPESKRAVMIKDLQRDPVADHVVHVDFVRVDLDKAVKVNVPIRLEGIPVGVKTELGLIEFVTREVEVECLPTDIPDHVVVDVSELHVNQHVSASDIRAEARVRVLAAPETIVAVVAPPRAEQPVATEAEEAAPSAEAEPEVAKKGKEGEEKRPESRE